MGTYTSEFTGAEIDELLNKVKSGQSGSGNIEPVVLWEGNSTNSISTAYSTTLELSDSIEKFDIVGLYLISVASGTAYRYFYREVPADLVVDFINSAETNDDDTISFCWGYGNSADYFDIQKSSTVNSLVVAGNKINATKIVGINY